jgi:ADP-heptose:LPS heptosyltransferase
VVTSALFLRRADKQIRRIGNGALFLFEQPRELPGNLLLLLRYSWHVRVRRKALVVLVRYGGLGDLICVLASVAGLRERHPDAWLVVATPPGCRQLAEATALPDATTEVGGFFHLFVNRMSAPSRYYQPLMPDEHDPPRPQLRHLTDEFGHALAVSPDPRAVRLELPASARQRVARRLRRINPQRLPVIVLHPGPSWPVREWPEQHWVELARLISGHMSAVMIRIGTHMDNLGRCRPGLPIPNVIDWTNRLDVCETAALVEQASVLVGIDSGPLHIAAVLGVPAIGLFGAVSAELRLHPRARTTVVTGDVGCLGCHHAPQRPLHWRTGCPHDIACMRAITAQEVFQKLVARIDGSPVQTAQSQA